jgi:hypothetical protein
MAHTTGEKILGRLKGLRAQMREGEQPLFSIPAIWENAGDHQSNACDLVLTNQRLFGYIYTTFPRERLFLDAVELAAIKAVTIRQKSFEVVFSELFVSDGQKRIYIRAPRKKIEDASLALRQAIADYAPATHTALDGKECEEEQAAAHAGRVEQSMTAGAQGERVGQRSEPIYGRQQVRQPLERSPLGITLLLVGGLLLEIGGALVWAATGSPQTGGPLFLAGLVAVIFAILARRQAR